MDHIPLPAEPTIRSIKIPYLCSEDYDGGPFQSYPERRGWQLNLELATLVFKNNGTDPSTEEIKAFLQQWLYFGLLSDTFGGPASELQRKFVDTDGDGKRILTSKCLREIVEDWTGRLADGTLEELNAAHARLAENLSFVQTLYYHTVAAKLLDQKQNLALKALIQYIASSTLGLYSRLRLKLPDTPSLESASDPANELMAKLMRDQNWCPSDIHRILTKNSDTVWFVANMPPPRAEKDHSKCSDSFCSTIQIDSMGVYELAHVESDCKCSPLHADPAAVRAILEGGDLPVLGFNEGDDQGKLEIYLASASNYVSISHIWAEGLGNPYANALQSCEIKRLFGLIGGLPIENPRLWIDTVCVPAEVSEAKRMAILKLKDTYRRASAVLVLDNYLLSFEAKGKGRIEILSRVENSSWCRRLWTLQEGRLNETVYFQFADGPLAAKDVFTTVALEELPSAAERAMTLDVVHSFQAVKNTFSGHDERFMESIYDSIEGVWKAVYHRALSVATDEPLCLGFMLSLDMFLITSVPPEQRMEALWRLVPKIPKSIVFSRAPSKLSAPGLQWAPASFLSHVEGDNARWWLGADTLWYDFGTRVTPSGLEFELPAIIVTPQRTSSGHWSQSLDVDGSHSVRVGNRWFMVKMMGLWNEASRDVQPDQCADPVALLLSNDLDDGPGYRIQAQAVNSTFVASTFNFAIAARVTQSGDVIHVTGLRHASIMEYPKEISALYTAVIERVEKLWTEFPPDAAPKDLGARCMAEALEAVSDPTIKSTIAKQILYSSEDLSDQFVMQVFMGFILQVFPKGYNTAQKLEKGTKWCIS